jgi:uncharacterized protein YegL
MRSDKAAILMILDMSGSMQGLTTDTVGGFNTFIEEQRKLPGDASVSLVLFNHGYEHCWTKPLKDVPELTTSVYRPMGNTALLDAIGRGVDALGKELADTPEAERPGKVVVVIMTDGEENHSREYSYDQIKEKIERQQKEFAWEFVFLGANIDVCEAARSIGVPISHAAAYSHDKAGTSEAYRIASRSVGTLRGGGSGRVN